MIEKPASSRVGASLSTRGLHTCKPLLKKQCDIGILREEKAGREKLFINPAVIAALKATN